MSVVNRIVDSMILQGAIDRNDRALYEYGLRQGAVILLNLFTVVALGAFSGMIWQSLLFMLLFIPLRTYAGGYHARTQVRCYFASTAIMATVLLVIAYFPWTILIFAAAAAVASILIFLHAPIADRNKPLIEVEVQVYGRKSRFILLFELLGLFLSVVLGFHEAAACIVMALVVCAGMVEAGRMINSRILS